MLVVDYGTIVAMDHDASKVRGDPNEESDFHNGHVEGIITLLARKGRTSRKHCLKVRKASRGVWSQDPRWEN